MSEEYQLESMDLEEKRQKILEAARKVLRRDREMMAKQGEIARRFDQLKAAWQEGGLEKMSEVYEEIARATTPLNPPPGK
jgi:hypothetical protein